MKGRIIVLHHQPAHAALVVDGRLEDLLLAEAHANPGPQPGEIWAAKVTRIVQGAAFLDLGGDHSGYLRRADNLKAGKIFPVQISSIPEPGKAIPVDRRLLLKGRGLILTPHAGGLNISRQIKDPDARARLTEALSGLPDNTEMEETGLIVRSAAVDLSAETLRAEHRHLTARLAHLHPSELAQAPLAEASLPSRIALRDWSTPLPDMIAVSSVLADRLSGTDHQGLFCHDPALQDRLTPGEGDPFDHFGVWDEIERLKSPRADLPSGGWMSIEATRAMITVDVNTGDRFGAGDAMTANIEAARELPRQLRLRGMGGQIILDVAPLKKQHRKKIEETLKQAFRRDPIDTTLAGWTPLGNFELTRKRERRPLSELLPT